MATIMSILLGALWNFGDTIQRVIETPFLRIGSSSLTLSAIAQFALAVLMAILFAWGFRRLLANQVLLRLGIKQGLRESIATVASYSVGGVLSLLLLQALGINLASVAVLLGSLSIGIGFGLQDLTRNFTSGIALLVEQKLKVGDFIEWEGLSGYIVEISLRSTVIRTITQRHIVIPNSNLVGHHVVNWTYSNRKGWVSIPVNVAHGSDPVVVIEALLDAAYLEQTVSYEYPPEVYFTGFAPDSLDFILWVWVKRVDLKHQTESSLRFIIEYNLRQHQIRLASPRLDLWHRNPNVVVQSSYEDYQERTYLHQDPTPIGDTYAQPVAVRDLLKQISYFSDCSTVELRKLVQVGHRRRLEAGETLYKTGDPPNAFYIILSGAVSYTLEGSDQLTVLRSEDFIGEFSLMLGVPRTVTVKAIAETLVFSISPQGFKEILQSQPRLYNCIVERMARHEDELTQQERRLRELGLINQEYESNPVIWVRKKLEKLFGIPDSSGS
ncbi:MAG: mechanosensitive ion channel domain-containing protein [Cyanobacteria bacterium P01_C01_bin.120]